MIWTEVNQSIYYIFQVFLAECDLLVTIRACRRILHHTAGHIHACHNLADCIPAADSLYWGMCLHSHHGQRRLWLLYFSLQRLSSCCSCLTRQSYRHSELPFLDTDHQNQRQELLGRLLAIQQLKKKLLTRRLLLWRRRKRFWRYLFRLERILWGNQERRSDRLDSRRRR